MILWRDREEDRDLRLKSWELILGCLPVTVSMDLLYGNFCAKDRSGACVCTGALDRNRFDEVVSEWAEILCPGDEAVFQEKFCLRAMEGQAAAGEREIHFLTGQPPKQILVRVKLIAELGKSYVEFVFEQE